MSDPLGAAQRITDLERRNRLLEQRLKQAERIRREWGDAVTQLRDANRREQQHLQELRDIHRVLEDSRRFIKGITDCVGEGIYALDHAGHATFMNPEAEAMLGWTLEAIAGRPVHELIHAHRPDGSIVPAAECPVMRTIATGNSYRTEEDWFQHRDGHLFPVAYVATPLLDGERVAGSVTVFQDITLRREMEAQLLRSERMAALGGMVAGVAHEINTPLGVTVTAVSHLENRGGETARLLQAGKLKKSALMAFFSDLNDSLSLTLSNLERTAELVRSFKMVSAEQTADSRNRFDLAEFLNGVLLTLGPRLAETPHRVRIDCPDGLEMDSYPGAIAQIVTNLIENSLVHGLDPARPGTIRIEARQDADQVTLTYTDDGKGIPESIREQVFEPFFTTRRSKGSTGLGLHILFILVTHTLRGSLALMGGEGGGFGIRLRLPRAVADAPATGGYRAS